MTYSQRWIRGIEIKANDNEIGIAILKSKYKHLKVGDVVGSAFDDTIGQIKGFYFCYTTKSVHAILGNESSLGVKFLSVGNESDKRIFNYFADINSNPVKRRMGMLLN